MSAGNGDPEPGRCPWCSAVLESPLPERCPGCGARLGESDPDQEIPGVTEVDPQAARAAAAAARRIEAAGRRRFGLGGETQSLPPGIATPPSPDALAPPTADVRREMSRLRGERVADAPARSESSEGAASDPA